MTENKDIKKEIVEFALRISAVRIKIETPNFVRDYRRSEDGQLLLVSEKAVIRALGKVSKVAIGEGEQYPDYEAAERGVRKHWSEYFRKRRERRTPEQKQQEARRQKRYRERRKQKETSLKRQQ